MAPYAVAEVEEHLPVQLLTGFDRFLAEVEAYLLFFAIVAGDA